eukprot:TRINITY_DN4332_c0_g1_i3.p2 TRINITY_DN4332_c0_g1~~TRINITY_DN4332_c0_g1_i3.p2  ORF type:complete len:183 (-),score=47.26 TRINITY_DN4332_c0_g1_i3:21-569(-)
MEMTGCTNRAFIRHLLIDNWGDSTAVVEFLLLMGPDAKQYEEEYMMEKITEMQVNEVKAISVKETPSVEVPEDSEYLIDDREFQCQKKETPLSEKKEEIKEKETDKSLPKEKQKGKTNPQVNPNPPSIHPKLAKFAAPNLSNKERKEAARHHKDEPTQRVVTNKGVCDEEEEMSKDLGSMQI